MFSCFFLGSSMIFPRLPRKNENMQTLVKFYMFLTQKNQVRYCFCLCCCFSVCFVCVCVCCLFLFLLRFVLLQTTTKKVKQTKRTVFGQPVSQGTEPLSVYFPFGGFFGEASGRFFGNFWPASGSTQTVLFVVWVVVEVVLCSWGSFIMLFYPGTVKALS